MRILFMVNDFYPANSAASSIIMRLSEYLTNKNHQVYVMCLKDTYESGNVDKYKDINILRIEDFTFLRKRDILHLLKQSKINIIRRLYVLIKFAFNKYIAKIQLRLTRDEIIRTRFLLYKRFLSKQWKKEKYEVVVSINADFSSALAAICVKKKISDMKYVFYQVDPYTSNYTFEGKNKYKRYKNERQIYECADKIITTPSIFPDIKKNGFVQYEDKVSVLEFPKVQERKHVNCHSDICLDKDYINLVYTGILYQNIRKPDYFLEVLCALNIPMVRAYFVGGKLPVESNKYIEKLHDRVFMIERVSEQSVINLQSDADILVNIGNTITNTLPSKIFEYISTGKPIINFYKIPDCPTLAYTNRYPQALNILEDYTILEENIKKIEDFIVRDKRDIEYNEVRNIYNDCTVEYVGEKFEKIISQIAIRS